MQKIEMLFYKTNPIATNTGMKFVLFEITDATGAVMHDWGFSDWMGTEWGPVDTPDDFTCKVVRWANTVDPSLLLNDKKIITR